MEFWSKELQESMDGCPGHHSITEIMLKVALNSIQLFSHLDMEIEYTETKRYCQYEI